MNHLQILEKILPGLEDLIYSVRYILTDHAETPLVDDDFINTNAKILVLNSDLNLYLELIKFKKPNTELSPDLEKLFDGAEELGIILEDTLEVITTQQNRAKIFTTLINVVSDTAPGSTPMEEILDKANEFTDYAMKLLERKI